MNENQGAKGGRQDRKRVFKIKAFYINKIKELNKNEKFKKKLKKKKLLELQILIHIIIKIIFSNERKKETKNKIVNKKESIKPKKEKKEKETKKDILEDIVLITLAPVALINDNKNIKISNKKIISNIKNKVKEKKSSKEKRTNKEIVIEDNKSIEKSNEQKINTIEVLEVLDIEKSNKKIDKLDNTKKELEKYKNNRIVNLYEDKFKEIRLDLKNLNYEYNLIEESYDHVKEKNDADEILKRLDVLIDKIKKLKSKLDIPNSDKYENSYIYELVDNYVRDFDNNKAVSSVKSSDLYIEISKKIKELEIERDYLKKKTEKKKQQLSIDEEKMKKIHKEKEKMDNYSDKLKEFTKKADEDLKKINEKLEKNIELDQEIINNLHQANNTSRNLLLLIGAEMMIPTASSAKKVAVASTVGIYLINKIFRKDKYKNKLKEEISAIDYSKQIEASLTSISKTISRLDDNIYDVGNLIYMLETEYNAYSDSRYKELLNNLYSIKNKIEEKRDNLIRIEKETNKSLNKNNQKIKVLEENM